MISGDKPERKFNVDEIRAAAISNMQSAGNMMRNILLLCLGGYFTYIFLTDAVGDSATLHGLMFYSFMLLFFTHTMALLRILYSLFLLKAVNKHGGSN